MILQPINFKVVNLWRFRRDASHSEKTLWVLQRSCKFILTCLAAGEQDLDTDVTTLLNDVRIRQPASTYMNDWIPPSLTNQPEALYSRTPLISGSDYEYLDSDIYDWRVVDAYVSYNEKLNTKSTVFVIQGQWDKYQGVAHSVVRRST